MGTALTLSNNSESCVVVSIHIALNIALVAFSFQSKSGPRVLSLRPLMLVDKRMLRMTNRRRSRR